MRSLLYITPYFPPQSKVGALRPLKFCRYLPSVGWRPVVLCDLRPSDARDDELLTALPQDVHVVQEYSWFARHHQARDALRRWFFRAHRQVPAGAVAKPNLAAGLGPTSSARKARRLDNGAVRFAPNPEWFPLGGHVFDIGHALRAGRRLLHNHPCSAILVNADPYASLLVGERLAREFGVPWVADLRDPWSVCDLRRPARPGWQRDWVDRTEARLIASSAQYVLNTERTGQDYREHFPSELSPRFAVIRNHVDPALFRAVKPQRWPGFSLVFFGTFRRFLGAEPILSALSTLKRQGRLPGDFRFRVVGSLPTSGRILVDDYGLADVVEVCAPRPYLDALEVLQAADVLLSLGHPTEQRIPAKLYDYFATSRPILHVGTPNRELEQLFAQLGGVDFCPLSEPQHLVHLLSEHLDRGRQADRERILSDLTSQAATRRMGALLDQAVERHARATRE